MTLLTEELKSWIGREVSYTAPEEVGRASIRYFTLAIGDDNPLYISDEYARANGYPSVIAPPTFVCETNQYMPGDRDVNGYIGHLWDPPVEGCRVVRGGHAYELFQPVLPGDRVTATWRLAGMVEREAKDGSAMLILTSVATYTNQRGETLATNTETMIYQQVRR